MGKKHEEEDRRIVANLKEGAPYLFICGGDNEDRYALVRVGTDIIPLSILCQKLTLGMEFSLTVLSNVLGRPPVQVVDSHTTVCLTIDRFAREARLLLSAEKNRLDIADYFFQTTEAGVLLAPKAYAKKRNPKALFCWIGKTDLQTFLDKL